MAQISQQFPSENGVSPQERGTSTRPVVLAAAKPLIPWSRYIPFAKGANLKVVGKVVIVVAIPFSGSATIDELSDTQFDFSVTIPPVKLPDFFNFDPDKLTIAAQITCVEDGSSGNKAVFSINGIQQQKTVHVQSKLDERILTPPGGLQLRTGFKSPIPETVEVRELHLVPAKDRLDLKVIMAFPIPDCTISVFRNQ